MCKLDEIMKKRETVYALARKYNVLRIFVFGSCARKEETPESDIDFLMDFKHGASMLDLIHFIDNIEAKVLLADRGYDSDAIVEKAESVGMKAVIPPRKNHKLQREYDKELYKLRHFVMNAFKTLARSRNSIRQKHRFVSCGSANQMYCGRGF